MIALPPLVSRWRTGPLRAQVALLGAFSLMFAGCSAGEAPKDPCPPNSKLVPQCPRVLVGVTPEEPSLASLKAAEEGLGRQYDFVYRFITTTKEQVADDFVTGAMNEGRQIHLSIDLPRDGNESAVTWAQVAEGAIDSDLARLAKGVAGMGRPVWITFEHEADNLSKASSGSGADFVRAWRHVHEVFAANGARNAVWVWVMMGTRDSLERVSTMWPGNDVVDWIGWDVYNPSGCRVNEFDPEKWVSFKSAMDVFYSFLKDNAVTMGVDLSKPMMIAELGTVADPSDPNRRAQWLDEMHRTVGKHPGIRAVTLWDHTGNASCDYRFSGEVASQNSVKLLLQSRGASAQS